MQNESKWYKQVLCICSICTLILQIHHYIIIGFSLEVLVVNAEIARSDVMTRVQTRDFTFILPLHLRPKKIKNNRFYKMANN